MGGGKKKKKIPLSKTQKGEKINAIICINLLKKAYLLKIFTKTQGTEYIKKKFIRGNALNALLLFENRNPHRQANKIKSMPKINKMIVNVLIYGIIKLIFCRTIERQKKMTVIMYIKQSNANVPSQYDKL